MALKPMINVTDTLAPSMFPKITLNKIAILVACTLMSDVACASTALKHVCAADLCNASFLGSPGGSSSVHPMDDRTTGLCKVK